MARDAGINQKLKMLWLEKIFYEQTDENHMLSVYDIIEKLAKNDIVAVRKTVIEDISLLIDFGFDIVTVNVKRTNYYYLASREFELPELKLLADSVSSAKFITERKSRILLKKIGNLAGKYHGLELNRRVYVANRVKSGNEMIYINIDAISSAINNGKKISFKYFDYSLGKRKTFREGKRICSPYVLTWSDGNYYMIAHYEKYGTLSNFRVDRMENVTLLDEKSNSIPDEFDLAGYMSTTFSMFSGNEYEVKLRFDNNLINAVIDRFGTEIMLIPLNEKSFTVNVKIRTGAAFYGWLFQFADSAEILSPENIRSDYNKVLNKVKKLYRKKNIND